MKISRLKNALTLSYPITLATLYTALIMLPLLLLLWPIPQRRRHPYVMQLWKPYTFWILRVCFLAHVHLRDQRSNPCPLPRGLVITNHQDLVDIPLIHTRISSLPLMKREILWIPFFGLVAHISGASSVKRQSLASRRQALKLCQQKLLDGDSLMYYPEGTRSRLQGPKPFEKIHTSLIKFAYQEQLPVTPIGHAGTATIFPPGQGFRPGRHLALVLKDPLHPRDFPDATTFAQACWQRVLDCHQESQMIIQDATSS